MKKLAIGIFILALLLTSCAPPTPAIQTLPTEAQPLPTSTGPTAGSAELTPAQTAALSLLSQTLSLPADQITLISTEAVTWPDGCLGVQTMGVMCTQALVEGYRILLEADGRQYEVRTNLSGSATVLASGAEVGSMIEVVLIRQLAGNLGLDEGSISVVRNEAVEFPDSCLGVAMQDVMCAQMVTPGTIVVLETDGVQYEYHVSDDGRRIQPATLALTWSRDGGIAGFCDRLTIFRSGEVYGNSCRSQPDGTMGALVNLLSIAEMDQFQAWMDEFGTVSLDASDPAGVSDRMTLTLNLYGSGSAKPLKDTEPELFTWAQALYQKLYE
jgi:hypothetical protein